jgi:hypothetical protein
VNRDLFVALYDGQDFAAVNFSAGRAQSVGEVVELLVAAHNQQRGQDGPQLEAEAARYDAFTWNLLELAAGVRVAQVPRPGVVLGVHAETPARIDAEDSGTAGVALRLRQQLDRGEDPASERFRTFLEGPAARWRPLPLTTVDVFVSFSPADRPVVDDLIARLEASDVSHIASPRGDGDDARAGIAGAALVLSVVSPMSVYDPYVLFEMGAAWALDRPILPARLGVEASELPDLMAAYQSRPIDSEADRGRLVEELGDFLTARLGE